EIALVDVGQRLAADRRFERPQALVDRQQLDDRRPRIDEILERAAHLVEHVVDLRQQTEGQLAGNDGRHENDQAEQVVCLQIKNAGDVEVHVVEIEAE